MDQSFWSRHYPPGVPTEITYSQQTIPEILQQAVERFANAPAFSQDGRTLNYKELDRLSQDWAAYLQSLDFIEAGDRIMVQIPNCLAFPVIVFGSIRAGLVLVLSNPLYTKREILQQLSDSKAKIWITTAHHQGIIAEVEAKTSVQKVILSDIFDFHSLFKRWLARSYLRWQQRSQSSVRRTRFYEALKLGRRHSLRQLKHHAEDLVLLQYTGGSSGRFKGAQLHHCNVVANMEQILAFIGSHIRPQQEVMIAALPLYHIFSFTVHCLTAVATGNHVVLVLDPSRTDQLVKIIEAWPMTAFAGLNPLFHSLVRHPHFKQLSFKKLHITIAGGMALNPEIARKWQEITGCPILEGFGMSETSPVVTLNPPHAPKYNSIGIPLPSTEVRIVNELNQLVKTAGELGELEVRGPQVMSGYWQQPEETRLQLSPDGWLKTGDLASFDKDGYLSIVGRKKRMIIVSGFNVYPQEVEEVLRSHPQVVSAKVSGSMHRITGETIRAEVLAHRPLPEVSELRRFCKERLAPYKVPRTVVIVEAKAMAQPAGESVASLV